MQANFKEFNNFIEAEKFKESISKIGDKLSAAQDHIKRQNLLTAAQGRLFRCACEKAPFEEALKGFNVNYNDEDIIVIRNLYKNTKEADEDIRYELLTIAKQIACNENKYHYNEIYAIAAFLRSHGLTCETLFIKERVKSGVYMIKSIVSEKESMITIKNRDTKKIFDKYLGKDTDEFAFFSDWIK